jgi:hypothetical protein
MSCSYRGLEYSEGAEVCQDGVVKICRGTRWEATSRDCSESNARLKAALDALPVDTAVPPSSAEAPLGGVLDVERTLYALSHTIVRRYNSIEFMGSDFRPDVCDERNLRVKSISENALIELGEPELCAFGGNQVCVVRFWAPRRSDNQ